MRAPCLARLLSRCAQLWQHSIFIVTHFSVCVHNGARADTAECSTVAAAIFSSLTTNVHAASPWFLCVTINFGSPFTEYLRWAGGLSSSRCIWSASPFFEVLWSTRPCRDSSRMLLCRRGHVFGLGTRNITHVIVQTGARFWPRNKKHETNMMTAILYDELPSKTSFFKLFDVAGAHLEHAADSDQCFLPDNSRFWCSCHVFFTLIDNVAGRYDAYAFDTL